MLTDREILTLADESEISVFSAGRKIASEICENSVKVVIGGSVSVIKKNGKKNLLMRIVGSGGILGVASVFTEKKENISCIYAIKEATILFITHEKMQHLILKNKNFAEKYIRLLTSKIHFLSYAGHSIRP